MSWSELDEDRKPVLHTGGDVLIKDATILTVTHGTIANGSILVRGGKIKAVGAGVTAPEGVKVINAAGMVAMPGIIDTHSHIAMQGGVNEGSLSIVPEVRVKDVVTGRRRRDLPGLGRRNDDRTLAARFGEHDRRSGRRGQAEVRQGRAQPDHPRRPARREVRSGRKRHAVARAVSQHADGRRIGHRTGLRGRPCLPGAVGRIPQGEEDQESRGPGSAAAGRSAAGGPGGHPGRLDQGAQPLLSQRRDPDAAAHRGAARGARAVAPARAGGLQGRRRDRRPRRRARRPFRTGGPTRSRPTTPFRSTRRC